MDHVVVIGAGQAGASCVAKLRNGGFEGQVTLDRGRACAPLSAPTFVQGLS